MTTARQNLIAILVLGACLFPMTAGAAPPLDRDGRYVVRRGDTLFSLADRFLVSKGAYVEVGRRNRITDPRRLPVGKVIVIPARLLRSEPILAQLAAFSGPVTINGAPAHKAMTVGQGAVIETGANAFVTLELPDESRITVPSQSSLRIDRLRRILLTEALDRVMTVQKGRSESVVTPMPNPASRYLINTPVASAAVRGTVFRVAFDPAAGRAAAEVLKGVVGVAPDGPGPEIAATEAFGVQAGADGVSAPARLATAPVIPRGGRDQAAAQVEFVLPESGGAKAYRLQLANDAGFIDIFREAEAPAEAGKAVFADVPDGAYFVRATAIDVAGLEGLPAVYGFTRELSTLEGGAAEASQEGRMRRYLFRWRAAGQGIKTFRFQLYAGFEGKVALVDEPGLTQPMITLTDLPPGQYQWRVVASTLNKGRMTQTVGDLQALQVGE